jgi:branched-chain amino acid transport system substrate-binding protein
LTRRQRPPDRTKLLIAALAALAAVLAGCASAGSGIQPGERVDVYVSMPLRGPEAATGRDVVDAARLALADAGGKAGQLKIRAVYLDDTAGHGARARWSPAAAAANARRASQDSAAIAYIGDFDSGATRFSLPITNEAHILQVSPSSAAVDLVQPFLGAGDQIPEEVQPTGQRTFGRVIPSDEVQADAAVAWAKRLGISSARVVGDSSSFSRVMESAFGEQARARGIKVQRAKITPPKLLCGLSGLQNGSPTHLLGYYAGAGPPDRQQLRCVTGGVAGVRLMTTDALLDPAGLRALAPFQALVTSAAQDRSQLPPSGQRFLRAFRERYGREPGRYAAYGYESMALVLDSIRRAGNAGGDRDSVVNAFFDTTDRHSILGTYSIDDVGNTTLNRLAGYRVVHGRPVFTTSLSATP